MFEFGNRVKAIQHFYFHNKITNISRLLGKLLTRIWWIYHTSSQLMIPINNFDEVEYENISDNSNSDADSDSDSDADSDAYSDNSN